MIWIMILICIIIFVIYVIIDNNSIKVKNTDVYIDKLPVEFNGFTILQLTDLHSKEFGENLYKKINNINYDMIFFTGDMINNKYLGVRAFENIIKNINNKRYMIYVDGNNGPKTYDEKNNVVTDFGRRIEKLGCILLKDIYCVQRKNSKIWLSNFDISTNIFCYNKRYKNYFEFMQKKECIGNDVSIGVGHRPVNKKILKLIDMNKIIGYKYNLIIVGHYHGGQFRFPFLGALFVPASTIKESFFPDKDIVKGIYTYKSVSQYVSTGLGASKRIKFLKFRLFNTPQIDVIKLKK